MCSLFVASVLLGALEYEIIHVPNDAVVHSLADAISVEEEERECFRYVWIHDGKKESVAAVSYTLNTAWSKASRPITYKAFAGNRLLRIDFRRLVPKKEDRIKSLALWDRQATSDPYFYVKTRTNVKSYLADDGRTYDYTIHASFGSQVDLKSAAALALITKTSTPIQRYDRFIVTTLTQSDDGLYYKIAGIRKSQTQGVTDFQQFAKDHGVDLKVIEELKANHRIALLKSEVTGKPRAAQDAQGPLGAFVWTEDVKKGNKDPKFHATKTLINMKKDAIEVIALKANGHCDYAIFDGDEKLVDTVPDVIAKDSTIPSPYEAILEPAISCIRCHDKENANGFRTTKNDIERLRNAKTRTTGYQFDIIGDKKIKDNDDLFDTLIGLYQGNLDRLNNARIDHSKAVFLSTGGYGITDTFTFIQDIDDAYRFSDINAQTACHDLGIDVSEEDASEMLQKLLPPESAPNGIETDTFGFLILGASVIRQDWELAYPDASLRSRPYYETLAKEKVKK